MLNRELEVRELQTPAILVSPSASVSAVLGVLKDLNVYEAFLTTQNKVGMITLRDLLKVYNITTRKIGSLIVYVPKLSPTSLVSEAARIMMEYRVRALPVVEGNKVTGEITSLAVIDAMRGIKDLAKLKAKNMMTAQPITLFENDQVSKARRIMIRRKVDHLPVLSDVKKLCGMLTSSSLVFNMIPSEAAELGARGLKAQRRLDFPVKNIMEPYVATCELNDGLLSIIDKIVDQKRSYLTVMLWEEVQGIITHRDIVKLISEPAIKADIPVYMVGLPEDPFEAEVSKSKFIKAVNLLHKSLPSIMEARSITKTSASVKNKERKRYEVKVSIKKPRGGYTFSETGWNLPAIYDILLNRMKRIVASKPSKKKTKPESF
ncbi:MAG: CBS domain-containing protein [Candidatus Bathyarchaeota archaeon]